MKSCYVFAILAAACCGCGAETEGLDQDDLATEPQILAEGGEEVGLADPLAFEAVCGEIPQSTLDFRKEFQVAWKKASAEEEACLKSGMKYPTCEYAFYTHLNAPSEERCGARVWVIPPGLKPEELLQPPEVSDEDTDGDGLSNNTEIYLVGSDPCQDFSLDPCVPDAEVDSDGDGIPNGKDPAPGCPGTDPGACI